jgi:hypothetical protein
LNTDYVYIDFEASGLHQHSFPIEVAWAGPVIEEKAFFLKPHPTWLRDQWDDNAELLHGISLNSIDESGIAPDHIAKQLQLDCRGKVLLTDGVEFDQNWLAMLFEAGGLQCLYRIMDVQVWMGQQVRSLGIDPKTVLLRMQDFDQRVEPIHRALDDVRLGLERINHCLGAR